MAMTDRLSRDFCYPDCPECDTPGWAAVMMEKAGPDWRCEWCGHKFNSPEGSEWYGVVDLPSKHRRIYIDRNIRGMEIGEVSRGMGTLGHVNAMLAESTKRINAARNGGAEADV